MKNSTNSTKSSSTGGGVRRVGSRVLAATMAAGVLAIGVSVPASASAATINPIISTVSTDGATKTTFTWFAGVKKKNGYRVCVNYDPSLVTGASVSTMIATTAKTQRVPFQKGSALVLKKVKKGKWVCKVTAVRSGSSTSPFGGSSTNPSGGSSSQPTSGGSSSSVPADAGAFTVPTVTLAKVVTRPVEAADFRATAGMDPSVTTVIETTYRLSGGTFQIMNPWTGQKDTVRGEDYFVKNVSAFNGMCLASGRGITVYPVSGPVMDLDRAQALTGPREVPGYSKTSTGYSSCSYNG